MIQFSSVTKHYGSQSLFEQITFSINKGERLGLIGKNGTGKSTILRLILGEELPDEGSISIPKGYRIGHLAQHLKFTQPSIVEEVALGLPKHAEHEVFKAEIILSGLGFSPSDFSRRPGEFSGGFQIRLNLAKLLLSDPDLLLLDEPTNYLDIISARWLVRTLQQWRKELILVTHDRAFMDQVTTHTMAIHRKSVRKIAGATNKLFEQIRVDEEIHEKTRINDEKKRKDIELFVNRFRAQASKAALVQSRIKELERMEVKEELSNESSLEFRFSTQEFHAKVPIDLRSCSFGYPSSKLLFSDLSLSIGKQDRIGIIGKNGRGKSTLLRAIAGELIPSHGSVNHHPSTSIGYFGQTNIDRLNSALTVEQEISSAHPNMHRTQVRALCGAMKFEGDNATKTVRVLSGGEKSRVLLGRIIARRSNVLLLDEPTNHLDMESIEALKNALLEYDGAVIIVTHQEDLLREICNRLIIFQGDTPFIFEGGYDAFLSSVGWEEERADQISKSSTNSMSEPLAANDVVAPKDSHQLRKTILKLEEKILSLEESLHVLQENLTASALEGDADRSTSLIDQMGAIQLQIDKRYEELELLEKQAKLLKN